MIARTSIDRISHLVAKSLPYFEDHDAMILYDMDILRDRVEGLIKAYPESTIHAIAMKANPLDEVLKFFRSYDLGVEVASSAEMYIASANDFPSQSVVYNSPAKTRREIVYALEHGYHINVDSFDELDRIAQIRPTQNSTSNIGIRVNPQTGSGHIESTSVATAYSKFGIPINIFRKEIIEAYKEHSFLNSLHLHIGSQGMPLDQLLFATSIIYDLAEYINHQIGGQQIKYFNIGGGLPVSYRYTKEPIDMIDYAALLKRDVPGLWSGRYQMVTEYGRYINANAAVAISKVEYIKDFNSKKIASIHLGADLLLRECYNPSDWYHEISVLDKDGNVKTGKDEIPYDIAGPLCFSGDIIAKDLTMPKLEEGDFIVVHDVGAYTLGMWSRYNSRQIPIVLGADGDKLQVLKEKESVKELHDFWKK